MTRLLQFREAFFTMKWVDSFSIGVILMLVAAAFTPRAVIKIPVIHFVERPIIVKKPVYLSKYDKRQIQCLTDNAYYEAGNQTVKGKIAVTNVVMNRTRDNRFPDSPCAVIYQKRYGICQFSWVCERRKRIQSTEQYADARRVAENVYLQNVGDVTSGAKFYHAKYVNPRWHYQRIKRIGDHIFYRG